MSLMQLNEEDLNVVQIDYHIDMQQILKHGVYHFLELCWCVEKYKGHN